ncbi:hypothetical protein CTI12_AA391110 [Artemisia annua]|uniref:Uncharacterized protein n=1 Tax=Artemisia annua TaxID=35608 RepID=A0A2U1MCY4_ARTAN|nr:hypothetical protein CTI12_AA391110 [Artemisia annua]
MNSPANYECKQLLDIDDSDLPLTPGKQPVRIIPGPAGTVQAAKLRKQSEIHEGRDESVLSTQEFIRKIVEDVGEDEDFKLGSWVSLIEYVNVNGGIGAADRGGNK